MMAGQPMTRGAARWRKHSPALALALLMGAFGLGATPPSPPETSQVAGLLRLTEAQYRDTVADLFGEDIRIVGRFEPDRLRDGLLTAGAGVVTVTPTGLEQYDKIARTIAAQIVDEKHRAQFVPCKVADPRRMDARCATAMIGQTGRLLFRRPLTPAERQAYVALVADGTRSTGDFYRGLEAGLSAMLVAPQFLFRIETGTPVAGAGSDIRLDGYSRAGRLSYLIWNSAPDDELLRAAGKGELADSALLHKQIDRMMASPRFERGARRFFADMFGFDGFATLAKDPKIYPAFTAKVKVDAEEQTMRLLVDLLLRQNADYRDIFTTRQTFLTRPLGIIYGLPVASRTGWDASRFPDDDPRAGLLSQLSFLVLYSHPGRSSPTLRGKAISQVLLCEEIQPPPADVNFALVQDISNPEFRTARQRLDAHVTDPTCSSCHKKMDPLGLALEQFDSAGALRHQENGADIDLSGRRRGMSFAGAAGLGKVLHDDPQTVACVSRRVFAYGSGRPVGNDDKDTLDRIEGQFAASGYRFRDLVKAIATSEDFYRVKSSPAAQPQVAAAALARGAKP